MATYVLVHGGFHGGWCWRRVADRLREKGHRVFTPTLTGLGERAHLLNRTINLATHIQDVIGVLKYEDVQEVILCGHSYGGMVITGAADLAPERLRALVYVDAFVPGHRQSLLDLVPDAYQRVIRAELERPGCPVGMPVPDASGYNLADPADRAWVQAMMTPHPFATFADPVTLTQRQPFAGPRSFIRALGYQRSHFAGLYARLEQDPSWRTFALAGGHDLMIDQPDALSDLLADAAA